MSSSNGPGLDGKTAKKRKAKAEAAGTASSEGTSTPSGDRPTIHTSSSDTPANGTEGPAESQYLKELTKNIRNIHKKLSASTKADNVIAENPDLSLDDLVASKKINADQKAQVLKKPALQAHLAQLEDQLKQFHKIEKEYEDRFAREKALLVEQHLEEVEKAKEKAAAEATEFLSKKHAEDLLVISRFLHAAAAKRNSPDVGQEESDAFEGVLLQVYQGNNSSLTALVNLIAGSEEKVPPTHGDLLDYTYAQIKDASIANSPPLDEAFDDEAPEATELGSGDAPSSTNHAATDPTIAHAGLTELEDNLTAATPANGDGEADTIPIPEQASVMADAANAVAESNWDAHASIHTTESGAGEGWVEVPRDPAETESGTTATPAAMQNSSSWAEEVTEGVAAQEKAAAANDGFEEVHHHPNRERGRGRGRGGEFRSGRGRGGEFRGRGRGGAGNGGDGSGGRGAYRGNGFRGGKRGGRGREGQTIPSRPTESATA